MERVLTRGRPVLEGQVHTRKLGLSSYFGSAKAT